MLSPNDQLVAATAVGGPTAWLIDEHNRATGHVTLGKAVHSGQAYFVVPHPGVFVVDVDAATGPLVAAANRLTGAAAACGVPCITVASGTPGHTHLYMVIPPGWARAALSSWCANAGLDVRTRGIRPPGAPHRNRPTRADLPAGVDAAAFAAGLVSTPEAGALSALAGSLSPVRLPSRVADALRHGHEHAGYLSPSHARMALAVAVRARGGGRGLLDALLCERANQLGFTFRARPRRWQDDEVARLWAKAGTWIEGSGARRSAGPDVGLATVDTWTCALARARFAGMAGASDLACAEAFARVARRAGTTRVALALADLAVAAGLSRDTARSGVRRLAAAGWLGMHTPASSRLAAVYELTTPPGTSCPHGCACSVAPARVLGSQEGPGPGCGPGDVGDLGADLARRTALGKSSVRVLRAAHDGAASTTELAAATGMSAGSVRHHVRKLVRAGLLVRSGVGMTSLWTPEAGGVVCASAGTAGRRDGERTLVLAARVRRQTTGQLVLPIPMPAAGGPAWPAHTRPWAGVTSATVLSPMPAFAADVTGSAGLAGT